MFECFDSEDVYMHYFVFKKKKNKGGLKSQLHIKTRYYQIFNVLFLLWK